MKPRRLLAARDAAEVFDRAVQERALAVLTLQDGPGWVTFKSRFLERDPRGHFFVLDHMPVNGDTVPPLSLGQYVGVSFRQCSRKILFSTVVEAKGHFLCDDRTSITAIRYRWPDSMTELQRRAYYRTPVPPEMTLSATLWAGGVSARERVQAAGAGLLTGDLADISCGGTLIHLRGAETNNWSDGDLFGLEVQLPDGRPPAVLDARYRGTRPDEPASTGVAFQFIGLELTVEGRLLLQRLAACIQRLHRLGIASGRRDWNSHRKA